MRGFRASFCNAFYAPTLTARLEEFFWGIFVQFSFFCLISERMRMKKFNDLFGLGVLLPHLAIYDGEMGITSDGRLIDYVEIIDRRKSII